MSVKPYLDDFVDPIYYLGFGVVSYFDLIKTMIFVFTVLSLVNLPNLMIYQSYQNYENDLVDSFYKTTTIGNMGFSATKCVTTSMETNNIILSCKTGFISKINDFGINAKGEDRKLCKRNQLGACAEGITEKAK